MIDNLKPSGRNELEITDALDILLEKNHNISFEMITDYWKDTGTPEDILNANRQVLEHICNQTCIIDKSTNIESGSSVITPSIILTCHLYLVKFVRLVKLLGLVLM